MTQPLIKPRSLSLLANILPIMPTETFICVQKNELCYQQNESTKHIYLIYVYEEDSTLNNLHNGKEGVFAFPKSPSLGPHYQML